MIRPRRPPPRFPILSPQIRSFVVPLRRPISSPSSPPLRLIGPSSRAVSFSFGTVGRLISKSIRIPVTGVAVGGGAASAAAYQLDSFRNTATSWVTEFTDQVSSASSAIFDSASDAVSSLSSSLGQLKDALPTSPADISTPDWVRSFTQWFNEGSAGGSEAPPPEGTGEPSGGGVPPPAPPAVGVALAGLSVATDTDSEEESEEGTEEQMKGDEVGFQQLTKKLIEIRQVLLSIDQSDSLKLPSIVVIGSQSSGKSSVLEAIVGHEFLPKGDNMVTRRPIELTLIHTPPTAANPNPKEYGSFPSLGITRVTSFSSIQKTLTELNLSVPASEAVSNDPIDLRIYSPHVPDLTLIDLPGYIQISSMDQPPELKDKIAGLCERYIQEPNIILAVCAADVDLANSPALKASREVDPLGLRTIGVVTKMDLVPPTIGAGILQGNRYPLHLGYIGVVCKAVKAANTDKAGLTGAVLRREQDYFGGENAVIFRNRSKPLLVGTDTLRKRLMAVLETSMASSLYSITNAVQLELEQATYQFKVQYNDRRVSPESYVAQSLDTLKNTFRTSAAQFSKPKIREKLKARLDDKVLNILESIYWADPRTAELSTLASQSDLTPEELDSVWQHKLETAQSLLTKSGVGRDSTTMVADGLRQLIDALATSDPFGYHASSAEKLVQFSHRILRDRIPITSDQVENCIKPYKYEVEVDDREWELGRARAEELLEREVGLMEGKLDEIRRKVGGRRTLDGLVRYVAEVEREKRDMAKRKQERMRRGEEDLNETVPPPDPYRYNVAHLAEARMALLFQDRLAIVKLRKRALRSKRCKAGPDEKAFCPEVFLNVVADKLAYTSVMFINVELLDPFFYQFINGVDTGLRPDLINDPSFARENSEIQEHLDLQERKDKLEKVMASLQSLINLRQDSSSSGTGEEKRKGVFGLW